MVQWVKNAPANAGDTGLIPGLERFSGGGNGNPLQYSCLENPMDRGAWWAIVQTVTESDMTEWLSSHTPNQIVQFDIAQKQRKITLKMKHTTNSFVAKYFCEN